MVVGFHLYSTFECILLYSIAHMSALNFRCGGGAIFPFSFFVHIDIENIMTNFQLGFLII